MNSLLEAVSSEVGKEVKQLSFYLVVRDGEIDSAFDNKDFAKGKVEAINQENLADYADENDIDLDDLTDEEIGECAFAAGFEGDHPYVEQVHITDDVDLLDKYETDEGDTFTYNEIMEAYISRVTDDDLFSGLDALDFEDEDEDE